MTTRPPRRPRARKPPPISREEYAAFIAQIELDAIWVEDAVSLNTAAPLAQNEPPELEVGSDAGWRPEGSGFRATHRYSVKVPEQPDDRGLIEVAFAARFRSDTPMTESIFATFAEVNLPVNTWPYLREFVQSMAARMGWQRITLPALKRDTGQTPSGAAHLPAPTTRTRARTRQ
jgi:hypothetical protein